MKRRDIKKGFEEIIRYYQVRPFPPIDPMPLSERITPMDSTPLSERIPPLDPSVDINSLRGRETRARKEGDLPESMSQVQDSVSVDLPGLEDTSGESQTFNIPSIFSDSLSEKLSTSLEKSSQVQGEKLASHAQVSTPLHTESAAPATLSQTALSNVHVVNPTVNALTLGNTQNTPAPLLSQAPVVGTNFGTPPPPMGSLLTFNQAARGSELGAHPLSLGLSQTIPEGLNPAVRVARQAYRPQQALEIVAPQGLSFLRGENPLARAVSAIALQHPVYPNSVFNSLGSGLVQLVQGVEKGSWVSSFLKVLQPYTGFSYLTLPGQEQAFGHFVQGFFLTLFPSLLTRYPQGLPQVWNLYLSLLLLNTQNLRANGYSVLLGELAALMAFQRRKDQERSRRRLSRLDAVNRKETSLTVLVDEESGEDTAYEEIHAWMKDRTESLSFAFCWQ